MKQCITIFVIMLITINSIFAQAKEVELRHTMIDNDLGVTIVYNTKIVDSWNGVTYTDCTEKEVRAFVKLLEKEYAKYPSGYLKKSLVDTIVLGNDLAYKKQFRAGVPDPYKKVLYLSVNGSYGVADSGYLIHTMHHELVHCTDVALWGDMYYDWADWANINIVGFKYGGGGVTAYADSETDYISPVHPQKGFINRYSMTGDEEDRAEMMAFWMTDEKRPDFQNLLLTDERLVKKLKLLKTTYERFAGEKFFE